MKQFALPLALSLALVLLAQTLNLPLRFGAHPWWSDQVLWIGLLPGLLVGALLGRAHLGRAVRAATAAGLAAAAFAAASAGKARFAASYAEDALAGQIWYFGWIGICLFATAAVATIALRDRKGALKTG